MQEPPLTRGPEDDTRESSDRAAKVPRLDAPDQQMMQISHPFGSLKQVLEVEHEDEPNTTYFEDEEVDNLELYDDQLDDFDYIPNPSTLTIPNPSVSNLIRQIPLWMR